MKKNITLDKCNEFDYGYKFNKTSLDKNSSTINFRELTKFPTTREFLAKKEKSQGIKIFKEELTKNINREDGVYKSPRVKVFELPDSKRVIADNSNYPLSPRVTYISPTYSKETNTNFTNQVKNNSTLNYYSIHSKIDENKKDKIFSSTDHYNALSPRESNIYPSYSAAGRTFSPTCDNFQTRNIGKSLYSRHGFTTQITTIPGGVKRITNDIKDDKRHERKNSQSYLYKLNRDFNTPDNNEFLNFKEFKQKKMFPSKKKYFEQINKNSDDNKYFNRIEGLKSSMQSKYKFSKKINYDAKNKESSEIKDKNGGKCPKKEEKILNLFQSQIVFC